MTQELTYGKFEALDLNLSFFPATTNRSKMTLLYFHGGGLIYGQRNDLPKQYIKQLTEGGVNLLTVDYPLAPESKLTDIISSLEKSIHWFLTNYQEELGLDSSDYCLFGRSAGAYLAFQIAHKAVKKQPKGIISFYGYHSLLEPSFHQPSSHYNKYAPVPNMMVHNLLQEAPLVKGDIFQRFPIYMSYRQTGNWVDYLLAKDEQAEAFSLTDADLKSLPATFIAASTGDQDVPYKISEHLAATIPDSLFTSVHDLPHDFDADTTNEIGTIVYQKVLDWLDKLI